MKALFFSDIHGIINNLNIIDERIKKENIDMLICLGDLYEAFSMREDSVVDPLKVSSFLYNHKNILTCMKGNCDTSYDINISKFNIYSGYKKIILDGLNIYVTHGNIYNMYNDEILDKGDILIYGHEHIPYIKEKDGKVFINVGSISLPRQNNNPTYAIYDNKEITIYDIYGNIVDSIKID